MIRRHPQSRPGTRRFGWTALALTVITLPFVFIALPNISLRSGEVTPWFPEGTPERRNYDRACQLFDTHDTLIVSWEGCSFDDPVLRELPRTIMAADRTHLVSRAFTHFDAAKSGGSSGAIESLRGFLVGKNDDTGCLIVNSTEDGVKNREATFDLVAGVVSEATGISREDLIYGGPCYLGISADIETAKTVRVVSPIVAILSLITAIVLLRSFPLGLLAFGVSSMASVWSITIIFFAGKDLGNMLAVVPSVAQLLAMSNAIHLINYYKEFVEEEGDRINAWRHAVRVSWGPAVTASLTTAIGFLSLYLSKLPVVKDFALFGSAGVLCSLCAVLLITPFGLLVIRPKSTPPLSLQTKLVNGFDTSTRRWPRFVAILLISFLIFASLGLSRLTSNSEMESFFSEKSKFSRDLRWYAQKFGSLRSDEILIRFPSDVSGKDQIDRVDQLTGLIREKMPDASLLSPSDGIRARFGNQIAGLPEAVIQSGLTTLANDKQIVVSENATTWKLTIRHPENEALRIGEFPEILDSLAARIPGISPDISVTGEFRLFSATQGDLLFQLLRSFFIALLIIAPIVIFFLRSLTLGVIAILGNLFPLAIFFGLLGWLGISIDIALMMVACVAFGIAVDDTVHYLTWLERGNRLRGSYQGSISYAYKHSAGAIVQTTLIISIGLLAFLISDFRPSVTFAVCSAIVLVLALVGDLILLPAIIRSFPGRRVYTPGRTK